MATCNDCRHHDFCEKRNKLILTADENYELVYVDGVNVLCKWYDNEIARCLRGGQL